MENFQLSLNNSEFHYPDTIGYSVAYDFFVTFSFIVELCVYVHMCVCVFMRGLSWICSLHDQNLAEPKIFLHIINEGLSSPQWVT